MARTGTNSSLMQISNQTISRGKPWSQQLGYGSQGCSQGMLPEWQVRANLTTMRQNWEGGILTHLPSGWSREVYCPMSFWTWLSGHGWSFFLGGVRAVICFVHHRILWIVFEKRGVALFMCQGCNERSLVSLLMVLTSILFLHWLFQAHVFVKPLLDSLGIHLIYFYSLQKFIYFLCSSKKQRELNREAIKEKVAGSRAKMIPGQKDLARKANKNWMKESRAKFKATQTLEQKKLANEAASKRVAVSRAQLKRNQTSDEKKRDRDCIRKRVREFRAKLATDRLKKRNEKDMLRMRVERNGSKKRKRLSDKATDDNDLSPYIASAVC